MKVDNAKYTKPIGGFAMIKSAAIKAKDGTIYVGKNHTEIIDKIPTGAFFGLVMGFVTDAGELVDREKAAEIAFKCGQIKFHHAYLESCDLDVH